ncbi:MAG: peptigoglycan-binding protein LysM, partial [Pseudaminobacter sp.]
MLFLAGGLAAAGVTAYMSGALDPYLGTHAVAVATQPEDGAAAKADPKTSRLPGESKEDASPEPAATQAEPKEDAEEGETDVAATSPRAEQPAALASGILAPSFDVVRAEPDGSIVIAGKAAPNAKVEIVIGAEVIGNAIAGPEGDFAVALDDNLKPGDHQIVLRSTAPNNVVATSPETAIVSIPETKDGQVLALVEQPGVPSKLISVPDPAKQADGKAPQPSDDVAAAPTPPAAESGAAEAPAAQAPDQQAA